MDEPRNGHVLDSVRRFLLLCNHGNGTNDDYEAAMPLSCSDRTKFAAAVIRYGNDMALFTYQTVAAVHVIEQYYGRPKGSISPTYAS